MNIARSGLAVILLAALVASCGNDPASAVANADWPAAFARRMKSHARVLDGLERVRVVRFEAVPVGKEAQPVPMDEGFDRRRVVDLLPPPSPAGLAELKALLRDPTSFVPFATPEVRALGRAVILEAGEHARVLTLDEERRAVSIATERTGPPESLQFTPRAWGRIVTILGL